jgi:hypothetical protein
MVLMYQTVEPPAFTPIDFGLLSVAEMDPNSTDGDQHWRNGVQYTPQFCGPALTTVAVCVTGGINKPSSGGGLPTRGAGPFAVYGWLDCSPVGYTADEWRRQTTLALVNNEADAVENVFATGLVAGGVVYPHLAANTTVADSSGGQYVQLQSAASVVVTGAGVDAVEGVGRLEGAIGACYGGTPVLHVPRAALADLSVKGLVIRDGNQLRTLGGSLVAAGTGYPGTAPDGSTPPSGTVWLYATGAVKIWRSNVELTGSNPADWIGRARNDQVLVAERTYVIGWDCCHFAVPVILGGAVAGTVGVAT